uniref:Pancreatic polypeptide n=1 Tax=Sarcophilus harrisii TaxID=9305 RepID=A0A7N4NQV9_SARHA
MMAILRPGMMLAVTLLALLVCIGAQQSYPQKPKPPHPNATPEEIKHYKEDFQVYIDLITRPRFGKRDTAEVEAQLTDSLRTAEETRTASLGKFTPSFSGPLSLSPPL